MRRPGVAEGNPKKVLTSPTIKKTTWGVGKVVLSVVFELPVSLSVRSARDFRGKTPAHPGHAPARVVTPGCHRLRQPGVTLVTIRCH